MEVLWEELTFGLPGSKQVVQVLIRLLAAALLGAFIGLQRETAGKPAGIRTHILVCLGTTVIVLSCSLSGMTEDNGLSRVIQGIVTGIGFIGAGSILKLEDEKDIKGLTTAAGIWMTSAIGVTVGLGELGIAVITTILTLIVLAVIGSLELRFNQKEKENDAEIEEK